jgi:hypothetical protein
MMCGDYQQRSAHRFFPEADVIMSHRNLINPPPFTECKDRDNYEMNLEKK